MRPTANVTAAAMLMLVPFTVVLWWPRLVMAQAGPKELANGIRLLEEGDLEGAVAALKGAIEALAADKSQAAEVSSARLYLATAHLGLSQQDAAREVARTALAADPQLQVDSRRYPRRLSLLVDELRVEARAARAAAVQPRIDATRLIGLWKDYEAASSRKEILDQLVRMGPPILPYLKELHKEGKEGRDTPGYRIVLLSAMSRVGSSADAEVLEALKKGLTDSNAEVRATAASELAARAGADPAAIRVLLDAFKGKAPARDAAADALARVLRDTSFRLTHDPVACMIRSEFPLITARIEPFAEVKARVFFRSALGEHWYYVEATAGADGQTIGAKLPRPTLGAAVISYQIRLAVDKTLASRLPEDARKRIEGLSTEVIEAVVISRPEECPPGSRVAAFGPKGAVTVYSGK